MAWMAGLYRFHTIFIAGGAGASFRDVDGNSYLDFNVCDLAMTMGYGPAPIVRATGEQMARGAHFLLATEDAITVAEDLAVRTGMPFWQFTVSASSANTEILRIARHMTGRQKVLVFGGHYHGHIDETLVSPGDNGSVPELLGLPAEVAARTVIVPFNDLAAAERVLSQQDIALVLTEPALTNCNIVMPESGFHRGLRDLTQRCGSLLCIDEAHTFQFAYGGLTRAWSLTSDFLVLGKGLGTGLSFALYGMTPAVADHLTRYRDIDIGPKGLATGGTTYGSAVSVAAAKAALLEIMTPVNYQRVADLGTRLSDGLDAVFARHRLPWCAFRLGPRAGYCMAPDLPKDGDEAGISLDAELVDTRRIYMANRGIWDAVVSAGPQASFAHDAADIDRYLKAADDFIGEIVG
ncbi:MAG TPA: aminotransferase class III-fold pyridoxal phosphate-dependent enzyme [Dongiaceae bacterium]|nr:aminotransferase class III-fold pyridoxal phosphate-dependent enzyme [Dongiaceae bacterium]